MFITFFFFGLWDRPIGFKCHFFVFLVIWEFVISFKKEKKFCLNLQNLKRNLL